MFRDFYDELPQYVKSGYSKSQFEKIGAKERLTVWKTLGDEVLFSAVLGKATDLVLHIDAFKFAVNEFNREWRNKPLKLKASAWLAGFPVTNTELEAGKEVAADYIGPSIDLGFRLTKFASERRFVISADLAFVLLKALPNEATLEHRIYFEGRESLKGVDHDRPYPVIWIDLFNGNDDDETKLRGMKREAADRKLLESYLDTFVKSSRTIPAPFIEGDSLIGEVPHHILERRKKMVEEIQSYRPEPELKKSAQSRNRPKKSALVCLDAPQIPKKKTRK